jgi:putative lipoprotein
VSISSAKTILVTSIISLCLTGCATVNHPDDHWFARDKAYHFAVASAISAGATLAAGDSDAAPVIGVGVAMAFGAGKETYDRDVKKTYWSWKDLAWDLAGAAAGALAATAANP